MSQESAIRPDRNQAAIRRDIETGQTAIGIELGSTRIKAVLVDSTLEPVASGSFDWENRFENGYWTYRIEDVWQGLQASFAALAAKVGASYGVPLQKAGAIGISGMMHGYMVFDRDGRQLAPFRTWRNTTTGVAAAALTEAFQYPIPQRWNIAHLYQAILNGEAHVDGIDHLTTLAGYVHWQLTGERILGIGEASGMFPIDLAGQCFDARMMETFDRLVADKAYPWRLAQILPAVAAAGRPAGRLTADGARLLDPAGQLQPGIPFCPPEGDAGTGMVATNSVGVRTGNVSAGTSVFAMIVLERPLSRVYPEIDLVTTPAGDLVAMVHTNNCTSDYDAWIGLFGEAVKALGFDVGKPALYDALLGAALDGDPDAGGLLAYGYVSGEHITGFTAGRPLFVRSPNGRFTLANFMRVHLFTALGALRTGLDILYGQESVRVDEIRGHGGFFKTREVGQRIMAAAANAPVSVQETAGEGGAWGIALLAAYCLRRADGAGSDGETLTEFLDRHAFAGRSGSRLAPDPADVAGFNAFMQRYAAGLPIERAAVEFLD